MSGVPGLAARLSAVLGRHVQGDERIGDVLVELLEQLERLLERQERP